MRARQSGLRPIQTGEGARLAKLPARRNSKSLTRAVGGFLLVPRYFSTSAVTVDQPLRLGAAAIDQFRVSLLYLDEFEELDCGSLLLGARPVPLTAERGELLTSSRAQIEEGTRMRIRLIVLALALAMSGTVSGQTYTINTFAGGGLPENIQAVSAGIGDVSGVATDALGNVYLRAPRLQRYHATGQRRHAHADSGERHLWL